MGFSDFDYGYNYMYNSSVESAVMGIIMVCLVVVLVCGIFGLISYILKGIGMYTMAKRQGRDYAWLAFVPFARTYLHGELAGSIKLKKRTIQNPGIWLLALPFIYGAVYSILYAIIWFVGFGAMLQLDSYSYYSFERSRGMNIGTGTILGFVVLMVVFALVVLAYTAIYKTFSILVNHQILERFTSKNMSVAHAILCTIIPMYESICLFVMRNRPFNPGMGPVAPPPFMQSPTGGGYYGTNVPPVPPVQGYQNTGDASMNGYNVPPVQGYQNTGDVPVSGYSTSSSPAYGYGETSASENDGETLSQEQPLNDEKPAETQENWNPVEERQESTVNFVMTSDKSAETDQPADNSPDK